MTPKEMLESLTLIKQSQAAIALGITDLLKNKDFPLEDRWELLLNSEDLLSTETYGDGEIEILTRDGKSVTPYDDFYIEKCQTKYYSDMWETIIEGEPDAYGNVDEWREAVLARGYGSFIYDW